MTTSTDTIAAVATPAGQGGIGVVRVSGPRAESIALALIGRLPPPRRARHAAFRDADGLAIDHGIALWFPRPASYTGDDVLELQGHGGPVVLDLVLSRVLALGARLARPGEFTERAFLAGRIDLAQAEAVADLIAADTAGAARGAMRSLEGAFSARVGALVDALTALRADVEASIDFADEDIDLLADTAVADRLATLGDDLAACLEAARQGALLRDGVRVVIAGRPNVGKSSLMNALVGSDRAIVTEVPGTTRDTLHERIQLGPLLVELTDTAGLRASTDPVERIGIERARAALATATVVLAVNELGAPEDDAESDLGAHLPPDARRIDVRNKIDLAGLPPRMELEHDVPVVWLSARSGAGIDLLAKALEHVVGWVAPGEGSFLARRRHLVALESAAVAVDRASARMLEGSIELMAADLRDAQAALGTITGEVTSDDLLGEIFARFCIGK
ncbi:MAG: tRNA uridine-5-carboxymethylaminomethyl(34) synthesis GTPase MnmE [Ectothiorhodospiraceae bacterium]|nr:tRNA uridine-5-carboxymethylaminomethyl(34) synthesis GTPase MnmE [Ectothiorhodospiraceae bacterium]